MKTLTTTHRKPKPKHSPLPQISHSSIIITSVTPKAALDKYAEYMEGIGANPRTIIHHREVVTNFVRSLKLEQSAVSEIDETHVGRWINANDNRKLGTRKNNWSVLNTFFQYCNAKGWVVGVPSKLCRIRMNNLTHEQKETKTKVALTDDEVYLLLTRITAEIGDHKRELEQVKAAHPEWIKPIGELTTSIADLQFWRAAIAIGRWVGLRIGDICQLEWPCFKTKAGSLVVWTDKRDKRVEVPIDPELEIWIGGIPKHHPLYVFPRQRELILHPSKRSIFSVQFKRMLKKHGIDGEGKSLHSLRSSFCQACDAKGIPTPHISRMVGHSSPETTRKHYMGGAE